ncbi:NADP-dependent oxidoreductase [Thioclava sp. GXIMD2076]|uniref:NADP-dependent oxidoreductase n=1 Tax=Thioclava sp. GXIMD2076 TaxID=3131931 RepID=UPI0030CB705C
MHAMRFHSFGPDTKIFCDEIGTPVPVGAQVLVRQEGSSLNYIDLMIRAGGYPRLDADALPYCGGRDVAGRVEALGPEADPALLGAFVIGLPEIDRGSFADYIVMNPSELCVVPDATLTQVGAAGLGALPLVALTAWQGLHDHGCIAQGQRVLITGGSGGVGHLAIQIAKAAGAEVWALASDANQAMLSQMGADHALSYQDPEWDEGLPAFDMVLDLAGGATLARSLATLREGGRLVSAVAPPDEVAAKARGLAYAQFFIAQASGAQLAPIVELVGAGQLRVHISETYPLAELEAAQTRFKAGGLRGKLAISFD